jgi:hypothetical protein
MAVLRGWWSRGILQDSRSVGLASSGAVRAVLRSIVGRPAIYWKRSALAARYCSTAAPSVWPSRARNARRSAAGSI